MSDQKEVTSLALPEQGHKSAEIIRSSARSTRLAAFTPANLSEAMGLAKLMATSDMVPKAYQRKPANILVAIQFGSEIGLAPMQSLQSVAVINGNPSLWGDAALALCQAHPDFEDIIETTEETTAKCIVKRKGRTPVVRTFSDADAQKAGLLTKGPWTQYRNRMRQLRARGFALRDSFADVLKGIKIAEEVLDIPEQTNEKRETAALDVAMLTPSAEPNRGHDNTGLERNGKSFDGVGTAKQDDQVQKAAKPELAMCSDCSKIGGHEPDCKYFVKEQQDKMTAQFAKAAYMLKQVAEKISKTEGKYLVVDVITQENKEGKLYVWHDHLKPIFASLDLNAPAPAILEVAEREKSGKKFIAVEHVVELAGQAYVGDKPAEQAEAGPDLDLFEEPGVGE